MKRCGVPAIDLELQPRAHQLYQGTRVKVARCHSEGLLRPIQRTDEMHPESSGMCQVREVAGTYFLMLKADVVVRGVVRHA